MEINEELVSKIKHLEELDLKGDLDDEDYELLKELKKDKERILEKENQKHLPVLNRLPGRRNHPPGAELSLHGRHPQSGQRPDCQQHRAHGQRAVD